MKKILVISDHPYSPTGVAHQTLNFIQKTLEGGDYSFYCLGCAVKHANYDLIRTAWWKDRLTIDPIDGFGESALFDHVIKKEKPDLIWLMSDFYNHINFFEYSKKIKGTIPVIYYHEWPNYPYPYFLKKYYEACDLIVCISRLTFEVVKKVSPETASLYLPHAVDTSIFNIKNESGLESTAKKFLKDADLSGATVFFWNNRNLNRKLGANVIIWFSEFIEKAGRGSARLIMKTDPRSEHGPDLTAVAEDHGLGERDLTFIEGGMSKSELADLLSLIHI